MMIRAFIFDLDGVLIDTDQYHYQAWQQIADSIGVYFDKSINNRLRGVSRMDSLEIILEGYVGEPLTMEKKKELAERKNEIYRKLLNNLGPGDANSGVWVTLKELKIRGYKVAVGSSSKNAGYILKRVKLFDKFNAISDGNNITRSKPDPEVFLKAAEFLGERPENCVVVEDAYAGIDAAKAGGMMAAAIGNAASYEKADLRLGEISQLLNLAKQY